ncbi:MAG: M23 family metallopeptidase [Candidatus Taylorbacteria bacterium]|nr:M23 family metallopeptidase [Candidatus Taylorbacteria bacterium]
MLALFTVFIFELAPRPVSADIASLLSSVFQNKNITKVQEIELQGISGAKNLQNMPILSANLSPKGTASSTNETKTLASVSEGMALTNENAAFSDTTRDVTSDQISLYTVRKGDRIEQIAKMFGVNVSTILWANDLKKGTELKPDQVLVILPISGVKYIAKKGDSLVSIAKAYKSDVDEIARFNNLDDNAVIAVGDEIIIPDAEGSLAESIEKKESEKKALAKNTGKTSSRVDTSGYFMRPIVGGVRSQGLHGHNGVDLASTYGSPILAAASGKVVVSKVGGWGGGYGNYVVIQHPNGTQTLYAHMSEVLVQTGETVSKGQQIGKMGSTGRSTGVHLHFEVRGGKNPF